jgi:acetyl esterase
MPLAPSAAALLSSLATGDVRSLEDSTVDEAREGTALLGLVAGECGDPVEVEDTAVPGPAGEVPVRIYRPAGGGPRPTIAWFHGGGWVCGSVEQSDVTCRRLAAAAEAVVVSVDYRRAPEARFPGPLEDCLAATRWCADHAGDLGGDPGRLVVGGDSAGGNLAAAVALVARDAPDGPAIALQLLVYPVTDARCDSPSYEENGTGYLLTAGGMRWFWAHYLGDRPGAGDDPLASPLRAPDLGGLPRALVITAEFDPLRDEGEAYASRLAEAGVEVTCSRYDGMLHGFLGMGLLFEEAAQAVHEVGAAVRAVGASAVAG